MRNSVRRAAFAVAATVLASSITVGGAHAATIEWTDRAGDVYDVSEDVAVAAPEQTHADLTKVRARHARTIEVTMTFVDLAKQRNTLLLFGGTIRTNTGLARDFSVTAEPGRWGGQAELVNHRGKRVTCKVRHSIDYDRNTARVVIPRTCLNRPRWVKVQVGAMHLVASETEAPTFYLDDSHVAGEPQFSKFTGRIRRG